MMSNIPRFNAQIMQISVPNMKDFEYEQNRSIYQALKAAGERINNTFFEMVAEGKLGEPNQNKQVDQNTTYWERYKQAAGLNEQNQAPKKPQENVVT